MNDEKKTYAQLLEEVSILRQRNSELEALTAAGRRQNEEELQQHRDHLEELIRQRTVDLTEERELLRILIDNMPDLILIKDLEHRFMAVNPALARLMGAASPDELLGTTDFDWYSHDYIQPYYEVECAILKSGIPSVNQEELHTDPETGEECWFLATKIPFRDQQNVVRGLVGISRDITEHKLLEKELKHHRDRLEELVKERTVELTAANAHLRQEIAERVRAEEEIRLLNTELEQRVRDRTAKLQTANHELKNFAYVVSHDLKAPLRAISRLADWLVNDYGEAFDDNGKEMAALLIGRVKRMDGLIDGILEYSRVGRIVGQIVPIDLAQLLPEILDSLAPPAAIRIEIAPELPVIVGDSIRIQQVFANLIGNAVKFMDKSRGSIRVDYADAGEWWQFSVTDNGPGIEPQHYERIFQIFQTLKARDELESTGVGLTIVKKIVELHGGRIWLESTPGEGSTFYFTLPHSQIKARDSTP